MRQSKAHARTIPPDSMAARYPDVDARLLKHEKALTRHDERKKQVNVSDKIAESNFWYLNWKWPGAKDHYPHNPEMRTVDKYYPAAYKNGRATKPLLVDEPKDVHSKEQAYAKQKILHSLGLRHIVVEESTTVSDALIQIGEL